MNERRKKQGKRSKIKGGGRKDRGRIRERNEVKEMKTISHHG